MSIILNDASLYRLENADNYKAKLDSTSLSILFMKYIHIIGEFFDILEKNKFKPNKGFQLYVVIKGIETINHIFKFLLMYTCNIDLIYFHSYKAYHYYIEFMDQISKDDHYFLRFNVRDAILFVYKKTIYEIDNTFRENINVHSDTKEVLRYFNEFSNGICDIIIQMYNDDKIDSKTKETFIDMIERYIEIDNMFFKQNIYKEYSKQKSLDYMFLGTAN